MTTYTLKSGYRMCFNTVRNLYKHPLDVDNSILHDTSICGFRT